MTPPVIVYLPPGDQWDQTMVGELLATVDTGDGLILVIPGRYWHDRIHEIDDMIASYPWVLAIRTGDEEDLFDITQVAHPNIAWWVQTPRVGRDYGSARLFGVGYTPHLRELPVDPPIKSLDVFLSAQDTHARRHDAFAALEGRHDCRAIRTAGFTQGLTPADYRAYMVRAKVAPCPPGPATPDTFRVYEALQAHAIPIADNADYWRLLFPAGPFPIVEEWSELPAFIDGVLDDWPRLSNRVIAAWILHKRTMARWLRDDLAALGAAIATPSTTVLITASPIASHPDTSIIEETVESVRAQLPDAEIIIAHDGVRTEQESMRDDYEEYLRRLLWLADHKWHNVLPLIFDAHHHQGVVTKRALEHVTTPLILFMEHDTPITGTIPWLNLELAIIGGEANSVRFHHEASILDEHRYLMLDDEALVIGGVPLRRTMQWSQRPHLASVAFYRQVLAAAFANDQPNFIEDVVYGRLCDAVNAHGAMGWNQWRTWIYAPHGSMVRSRHTDGRCGASKFT